MPSDQQTFRSPDDTTTYKKSQKDDDAESFKSTRSVRSTKQSNKHKLTHMQLKKVNVIKEPDDIDRLVTNEEQIDLEKIRKKFKNLVNDQRFL